MRWLAALWAPLALWAMSGALSVPLGLDAYIPSPESNPLTEVKVSLGRALFLDTVLSRDHSIACQSCHARNRAFTDALPVARGIDWRTGTRRTPTLVNRAYGKLFFWDGRLNSLETQVLQPIANPKEMDLPVGDAVSRLRDSPAYAEGFRKAFDREVCEEDLARALAAYVRTILSGDSPYDRYLAGNREAMSEPAQRGLKLFRTKAGCLACHVGFNFTDEGLHRTGAGKLDATGRFKTPTLREVARRRPYMHDGSLEDLDEVIDFYNDGGKSGITADPEIRKLGLTEEEKADLKAFLEALSGTVREGWR